MFGPGIISFCKYASVCIVEINILSYMVMFFILVFSEKKQCCYNKNDQENSLCPLLILGYGAIIGKISKTLPVSGALDRKGPREVLIGSF